MLSCCSFWMEVSRFLLWLRPPSAPPTTTSSSSRCFASTAWSRNPGRQTPSPPSVSPPNIHTLTHTHRLTSAHLLTTVRSQTHTYTHSLFYLHLSTARGEHTTLGFFPLRFLFLAQKERKERGREREAAGTHSQWNFPENIP